MSKMRVLKTSLQASIQDLGRIGFGDIGVTQSGAADEFSFNWANNLLGNSYGTNAMEISYGGVSFSFDEQTAIAITGANVKCMLNKNPIPMWQSINIKAGDTLELGFSTDATTIYLGIKDGFIKDKVMGSASVSIKENIGGTAIKIGDELEYKSTIFNEIRHLKKEYIPKFQNEIVLRLIKGYQYESFKDRDIKSFFSTIYEVSNQTNRMGTRLSGEPLQNIQKGIISEGISYGAVQIPPHGEPIVLLKERQSIGGYPKIGSIIPQDCFLLSQAKPKTKVRFQEISLEEASVKMKNVYEDFSYYM